MRRQIRLVKLCFEITGSCPIASLDCALQTACRYARLAWGLRPFNAAGQAQILSFAVPTFCSSAEAVHQKSSPPFPTTHHLNSDAFDYPRVKAESCSDRPLLCRVDFVFEALGELLVASQGSLLEPGYKSLSLMPHKHVPLEHNLYAHHQAR